MSWNPHKVCFHHNIFDRIALVRNFYRNPNDDPSLDEEKTKTIEAGKSVFHDFVERVVKNPDVIIPEPYSRESLKEILEKSEFDWKDTTKFIKFYDYMLENYTQNKGQ
jgi:hypothetical protein